MYHQRVISPVSLFSVNTSACVLFNQKEEQNVESSKKPWDSLEAKYMAENASSSHLRIEESLRVQDSDKPKGNNVSGPSVVNMMEHNNFIRYNDDKGKCKHQDTKTDPNKKSKVTCWKCGKPRHLKKDCKGVKVGNKANGSGTNGSSNSLKGQNMFNKSLQVYYVTYVSEAYFMLDDDVAWWVDSGVTVHVCKDRCWFKTRESLNDGSILHMGNESTTMVHRRGSVDLIFSSRKIVSLFNDLHVPNIRKNLVSSSILNNCGYKQVIESNKFILSKHGVFIGFGYLCNHMFKLNIVNDNIGSVFMSTSKLNDSIRWHARLGHVHFKRMQELSKDGLILAFDMDTEKCKTCMLTKITKKPFQNVKRKTKVLEPIHNNLCDLHATPSLRNKKYFVTFIDDASRAVVRLLDPKLKTLSERGIECIFVGYAEHSKTFRFYVIEPNESVLINLIIKSRDLIFDKNRFSSVPKPSHRFLINGTEDIGGSVVLEEVTEEVVVQQPEPELRKSKRNRIPKNFGPEFQLYLIEGTRDEVSDQHSYCFNVEDDPKTFDEAMKSNDLAFWKEAINDEVDSIMGNNIWVLAHLPPSCKPLGCKWIFKRKLKLDGTIEKFKARLFSIKDMGDADVIFGIRIKHESNGIAISQSYYIEKVLKKFNYFDCTSVSTPMDTSEKLMPNNGQVVSQLKYSRVIGCLMYAMTCTRPNIAFVVGKLILEGYTDASWISNTEDNSSTSGWVFLLGGGAISWASKKQTCITSSTMESEFIALAAAGKEAEWLRNLIRKISLWSKPIEPISIRCDSDATLAKAYSQMYNGKSRYLGVRHSMICELIMNGV
ncbi:zinc finger, CCHC-type containing protein [Tanacetum coccineum]